MQRLQQACVGGGDTTTVLHVSVVLNTPLPATGLRHPCSLESSREKFQPTGTDWAQMAPRFSGAAVPPQARSSPAPFLPSPQPPRRKETLKETLIR